MSVCISSKGEFGSHDLDDEYTCRDCGAVQLGDALRSLPALGSLRTFVPTLDEVHDRVIPLAGQMLASCDFGDAEYGGDHERADDLDSAQLITSIVDRDRLSHLGGEFATHKMVVDIDLPCVLVESSTPGHFHLIVDQEMGWTVYVKALEALVLAGIVEPGYLAAAIERGHTAVRLPWVRKAVKP